MNKMNRKCLFIIVLFFVNGFIATSISEGAELFIRPSIDFVQEYNDNIYLSRDSRKSDYISRALPSLSMSYKTPFWEWQFNYMLNWWYYHNLGKSFDSHSLDLTSKLTIIDNFLYLDIKDNYANIALDERRSSNEDNLNVNRTDTNTLIISPYIKYRLTPIVSLTTGYKYTNTWYRVEDGINRQMHTGYITINYMINPKFNTSMGVEYTMEQPENQEPRNKQTLAFISASYVMSQRTNLDGSIGFRQIEFSKGNDESSYYYNFIVLNRFHEHGNIELGIFSEIISTALYGVQENRTERLTISYGDILKATGSIFHSEIEYLEDELTEETVSEKNLKNDIVGVTTSLEYRPTPLLTFRISGAYQEYSYLFQRYNDFLKKYEYKKEIREVYTASSGMDYRVTEKITVALTYSHTKENGRTASENYRNNIVAVRLRINI